MVNTSLVEAILREQKNPGCSTTRQIRDLYNSRSGDDPIIPQSDEDKQFQKLLLKALEECPVADDEVDNEDEDDEDNDDEPISYTVKLKDSDETVTPKMKHRSIIKLSKESKSQSESDESSSDSEKTTVTNKPFSPLFLNNMKKFGVSSDWLAKRSNSLRQSAYSLSSVKSNTSKLDAMIKSASAKPVRSNRKLSFVEGATSTKVEADKENADPASETHNDQKDDEQEIEEIKDAAVTSSEPAAHDLSSEVDEDEKGSEGSSPSKDFSLRIPRIDLPSEEKKRSSKRSSSSASSLSDEEVKPEKPKPKLKKRVKKEVSSKKATPKRSYKKKVKDESTATNEMKPSPEKDDGDKSVEFEEKKDVSEKNEEDESATTTDTKKSIQKKGTSSKKATSKRSYKKKVKEESATTNETKPSLEKDDNAASMEIDEEDESVKVTDTKKSSEKKEIPNKKATPKRSYKKKAKDESMTTSELRPSPQKDDDNTSMEVDAEDESVKVTDTKKSSEKEDTSGKKATPKRSYKKKSNDESTAETETKLSPKKDDNDTSIEIEEEKDTAEQNGEDESATTTDTKKAGQKKDKADQEQSRVEHLKKLLRISGIRHMIKKSELDEFSSHKAKIKFLKSLFDQAGYTGNLSIKECQKFREKRDTEKELLEIQQSTVDVKGYVKGGRTLRGQGRVATDPEVDNKRKRVASSEVEDNEDSSDSDKPITKKRRVLQMEASPEISDNE